VHKEVCSDFLSCFEAAGESFLSLGMKYGPITLNSRQKTVKGITSSNFQEVKGYPFNTEGHGHYFEI
jgi:hypothetical protein